MLAQNNTAVFGFRQIFKLQVIIPCFFCKKLLTCGKVGALGIVDTNGELVGTLSASDVRGMQEQDLPQLFLPVMTFLRKRGINNRKPIFVGIESTLEEVIKEMLDGRVHRVWICSDDKKPIGVVTMTDIVRLWSTT